MGFRTHALHTLDGTDSPLWLLPGQHKAITQPRDVSKYVFKFSALSIMPPNVPSVVFHKEIQRRFLNNIKTIKTILKLKKSTNFSSRK